jgi:hypothetical protein
MNAEEDVDENMWTGQEMGKSNRSTDPIQNGYVQLYLHIV